ncbi:hypothetical protein CABS01_16637 [Colletotrichum abscissum]|uniref:uncharacterized protein n=1 Tax=Colletotrichum abscissum TaxID=1671311 RepID=UPI0027D53339|nr:uncharacterized protein CABS01_16637 [Colletotrichum abscissum]KAK1517409.1 hypothetical protein CABS01_16637 [Colletotrichum abscissum]
MAPHLARLSRDLLRNIIYSKLLGETTATDDSIADLVGCHPRTVRRIRSKLRTFGTTETPTNTPGRPKSITPPMLSALRGNLAVDPCLTLNQMAAFLRKYYEADVSRFSISRTLRKDKWSQKATQNVAQERNLDLRDEFMHQISQYRSEQLVFVDESGIDKSIGIRRRGWAPRGKRPRQIKRFHRGRRYQILPAYTQDGVIHFRVYEGSTDAKVFESFIEILLLHCGRWPEPRSVLIMDNASFHHSDRIRDMCAAAGVVLLYSAPYSPDIIPIEHYFGELKNFIRQVWNEHQGFIRADFRSFLEECVTIVGRRKKSARGHFYNCSISIDEPLD